MLMADLIFFSLCTFQLHFRMMVRKLMMRMLRRRYQIEMWAVDVGTPQARWQEKPIAKPAKVWQADKHLFQLSTHSELKSGFNETCLRNFSVRFLGWSTGSTCSRSVGYVRSTTSSNSSSSSIAERCGFAGTSDNIGHIDNTIHQLATGQSDDCFYSWHVSLTCKLNFRKMKRSCMLAKSEFHEFAYFASFFFCVHLHKGTSPKSLPTRFPAGLGFAVTTSQSTSYTTKHGRWLGRFGWHTLRCQCCNIARKCKPQMIWKNSIQNAHVFLCVNKM